MKKWYSIFIITGVFFANIFFVAAATDNQSTSNITVLNEEIAKRKDKIEQLEKTINDYKSIIEKKETESVSLKNQMSILSNRVAQLQADIDLTNEKIDENQLEIDALNISIAEKERTIEKQKKIISKMVIGIHGEDRKNYFEILLTYKNFADFYNQLLASESVYIDLGRSVKALKSATDDLNAKKAQVETKKKVFEDLQKELQSKKDALNTQQVAKQQLLADTQSSEAKYQTLLSSLKRQYQVIENEQKSYEDRLRKQLEDQKKIVDTGSVLMSWPVPSHIINAYFHDTDYPFKKVMEHSGIDIKASQGTPVKAAASGYVARAKKCTTASCYSYVLIIHTGNISSLYGHLSSIGVTEDQYVNRGDVIGYSGGTPGAVGSGPFVTGPHLHFEVRLNGIPSNPLPYMEQ